MKILSLFDGMSVAQQALKEAGIPVEVYYASEIDEYAMAVTQSNFPATRQLGGVSDIQFDETHMRNWIETKDFISSGQEPRSEFDLMIGGSPCQDLSIAKKGREGLSGSRSGLFWEYVRIRDEVKPKYFILENVNSMPKEAKDTISEALGVHPVMINASLVSAQNRKRLFWVGKWNGEKYEQVEIPQPEDRGILLRDILEGDVDEKYYVSEQHTKAMINTRKSKKLNIPELTGKTGTLTASYYKIPNDGVYIKVSTEQLERNSNDGSYYYAANCKQYEENKTVRVGSLNTGGQGDRIYSEQGKSVALSANGGGRGAKTGLYAIQIPEATKKGYALATEGQSVDLSFPDSKTRRGRVGDKVKNLMTSQNIGVVQNMQIRKLTPTECLRLQSMPDNYFDKALYKGKPISNTQRYKMCGNAFNKEVIVHILKNMLK